MLLASKLSLSRTVLGLSLAAWACLGDVFGFLGVPCASLALSCEGLGTRPEKDTEEILKSLNVKLFFEVFLECRSVQKYLNCKVG